MIIVSQNKRITTESLALSIENIENKKEKKIMVQENCGKLYLLGVYATEERAKEVLKDIYNTKAIFELYKSSDTYTHDILVKKMIEENLIYDTYEMPEE